MFRRHYGQRNIVDYRDTSIFPDSGGIPPLRLTICMNPQWGYQQEWRMENQVRMKALYAASVNG